MRGVTSSSVSVIDCRLPANSRAAAKRRRTVIANEHMAAEIFHPDKCFVFFSYPWNSLRAPLESTLLYVLTPIFLQAQSAGGEWREASKRILDWILALPELRTHREKESFLAQRLLVFLYLKPVLMGQR